VRICEAALSRTEEECQPTVRGVRTGEPVSVAEEAAAFEASLTAAKDADRGRTAEASRRPGKKRIRTLAPVRLNAQHLKDTSLFRVSLVDLIVDTPGQELGSHTFSHYYCLEPGRQSKALEMT